MSNIAIIGEKEIVIGFSLIGFQLFPVSDSSEAKEALEKCTTDGNCSIVFITDNIAQLLIDEIEKYQRISPISICILPDRIQDSKLNIEILRKNVEKAVGTDILFRKEE
jgi:V/A-type H+-transporting ATPase subunit F